MTDREADIIATLDSFESKKENFDHFDTKPVFKKRSALSWLSLSTSTHSQNILAASKEKDNSRCEICFIFCSISTYIIKF